MAEKTSIKESLARSIEGVRWQATSFIFAILSLALIAFTGYAIVRPTPSGEKIVELFTTVVTGTLAVVVGTFRRTGENSMSDAERTVARAPLLKDQAGAMVALTQGNSPTYTPGSKISEDDPS